MYLAFDVETTGLDPHHDHLLEVAWTFLDDDLSQKKSIESRVVTPTPSTTNILRAADPIVIDMHSKTGLLEELDEEGTLMKSDIEDLILKDILNHLDKQTPLFLFGMGPQFDRQFIQSWMPRLNNKLHYRHFDVRTLTAFFENLGIEHGIANTGKHRAGPDVAESILIAQFYRIIVKDLVEVTNA